MHIYIVQLLFLVVLGLTLGEKKRYNKLFLALSFGMMAIVLGLRGPTVGEDTRHFIDVFNCIKTLPWSKVFSGFDVVYTTVYGVDLSIEVGYVILNKIVYEIFGDAQYLLIVCAILTCGFFAKFIYDNFEKVFFPTFVFFAEAMYMHSFNLMRQMLAISIGILAVKYLNKNHWKIAVLFVLIAFLFHKTALVLFLIFPLILVKNYKRSFKYFSLVCASVVFLMPVISTIISWLIPRYANYFLKNFWGYKINGVAVLWTIEILCCLWIYLKRQLDQRAFFILSSVSFYLMFQFLGLQISVFQRIALCFNPFLIFLLVDFEDCMKGHSKMVYKFGILTLLTLCFLSYAGSPTRIYQLASW